MQTVSTTMPSKGEECGHALATNAAQPVHTGGKLSISASAMMVLPVLGVDCEMAQGIDGRNVLLRATVVNERGQVVLDAVCKPRDCVTDYRTRIHGIRKEDVLSSPHCAAQVIDEVHAHVLSACAGSGKVVVVGHNVREDLRLLCLDRWPMRSRIIVRDTAAFVPFQKCNISSSHFFQQRKLKDLALEILGVSIQDGAHDSTEDAAAALLLYMCVRGEWEKENERTKGNMNVYVSSVPTGEPMNVALCAAHGDVTCVYSCPFVPRYTLVGTGSTLIRARKSAVYNMWKHINEFYESHLLPDAQCKAKQLLHGQSSGGALLWPMFLKKS